MYRLPQPVADILLPPDAEAQEVRHIGFYCRPYSKIYWVTAPKSSPFPHIVDKYETAENLADVLGGQVFIPTDNNLLLLVYSAREQEIDIKCN